MRGLADSVAGHIPRLRSAWPAGEAADAAVADVQRTQTFTASVPPVLSGGSTALEAYHAVLVSARKTVDSLNAAYAVLAPVQNRVAGFGDWIDARQAPAYEKACADYQFAQSQTGYASAADIDTGMSLGCRMPKPFDVLTELGPAQVLSAQQAVFAETGEPRHRPTRLLEQLAADPTALGELRGRLRS